jgi:polysaccharide chain length determinant protein (PEP-CTERM system associated)
VKGKRRKRRTLELAAEVWKRRKWSAVLAFSGVLTLAMSVAMALPDLYSATVTVAVEQPLSDVRDMPTGELETRLHAVSQEILSRSRLLSLIDRENLYSAMRGRSSDDALVRRMRRDITLEPKEVPQPWGRLATVGFALSYRGREPNAVAAVANALASLYVDEEMKLRERQASGAVSSLRAQLEDARGQLEVQERRVSAFKRMHVGELPEQMEANLSTLERLNAQLGLASNNLSRAQERRRALLRDQNEPMRRASGTERADDRLARMKQELALLQQSYTDKYPDVARLKAEIADLEPVEGAGTSERSAEEAPAEERPSLSEESAEAEVREIDAEIESLGLEEERLKLALGEYQRRVENAPRREQEFLAMARDYAAAEALYESQLKRYEEAELAGTVGEPSKGERFRILDPALVPQEPDAPNRLRLLIMGLILAVGAAVGVVVLAEEMDTSFHGVEDLRSFTRVPVLATIPRIASPLDTSKRRWRALGFSAAAMLGLVVLASASYLLAVDNDGLVSLLTRGR